MANQVINGQVLNEKCQDCRQSKRDDPTQPFYLNGRCLPSYCSRYCSGYRPDLKEHIPASPAMSESKIEGQITALRCLIMDVQKQAVRVKKPVEQKKDGSQGIEL